MKRSVYYIKFYKPWQFIIDAWDQAVAKAIAEGEEEEQMATTIALALCLIAWLIARRSEFIQGFREGLGKDEEK